MRKCSPAHVYIPGISLGIMFSAVSTWFPGHTPFPGALCNSPASAKTPVLQALEPIDDLQGVGIRGWKGSAGCLLKMWRKGVASLAEECG